MTVSYAGTGSWTAGPAGTVSPFHPTVVTAGQLLVLLVGMKPSTANSGSVTTPSGWTLIGSITGAGGYGTTLGADTGNTNWFVYTKVAVGDEDNSLLTVTIATSNISTARIMSFDKSLATWSAAVMATGSRTSTPVSPLSVASGSIDLATGDFVLAGFLTPTDVTTPSQYSAVTLAQTGTTFGTVTEVTELDISTNNDLGGTAAYAQVTSGSGSGAVTFGATLAGTLTNVRGPLVVIRLRDESGLVDHAGSAAYTAQTSLTATAVKTVLPSAAFTDDSVFTATGTRGQLGSAAYTAESTFTATAVVSLPVVDHAGSAAYSGQTSWSATAVKTSLPSQALTAQTSWSATAVKTVLPTQAATAQSSFSATAVKTSLPSAAFSDDSVFTAAGTRGQFGSAAFSDEGVLTAAGLPNVQGSAAFTDDSVFTAAGARNAVASAALTAESALAASADVTGSAVNHQGAAAWSAEGVLSATAVRGQSAGSLFWVNGQANAIANGGFELVPWDYMYAGWMRQEVKYGPWEVSTQQVRSGTRAMKFLPRLSAGLTELVSWATGIHDQGYEWQEQTASAWIYLPSGLTIDSAGIADEWADFITQANLGLRDQWQQVSFTKPGGWSNGSEKVRVWIEGPTGTYGYVDDVMWERASTPSSTYIESVHPRFVAAVPKTGSVAFSAQTSWSATAVPNKLGSLAATAQTVLSATAVKGSLGSAAYSDTSVFTATAVKGSLPAAAWTAESSWAATSVAGAVASAGLTGQSVFTATGTVTGTLQDHDGSIGWSAQTSFTGTPVVNRLAKTFWLNAPRNAVKNGDFEQEWSAAYEDTFFTQAYRETGFSGRSTEQAHSGTHSFKLEKADWSTYGLFEYTVTGIKDWNQANVPMTLSSWVWIPSGLGITDVRIGGEYGPAQGFANMSLLDQWQQIQWTIPGTWGWTYNITHVMVSGPAVAGQYIYIDDVMWERAATASTTYIPYTGYQAIASVQRVHQGAASWVQDHTVSYVPVLDKLAASAWTAEGTLVATGAKGPMGSAAWDDTSSVTWGTPDMDRIAAGSFTGVGTLVHDGYVSKTGAAAWDATGTLTATGKIPNYCWLFEPPSEDTEDWRGLGWHRLAGGRRVGVTLLRINGEYVGVRNPTAHAVGLADRVYPGGRVNELSSRAEAQELTSAGFSVSEVEL